MANPDIIPLTNEIVPTILSFDDKSNSYIIGNSARVGGLKGRTSVFNFKPDIGNTDKVFSQSKTGKYWITKTGRSEQDLITLTPKEATVEYLRKLLKDIELPAQIIVGEPAVTDEGWKENFRNHMREVFQNLNLGTPQFFYEPFAVFQYYRHIEKILWPVSQAEIVLVIDIGGGTFSSCVIRTTEEGDLARGGPLAVPLGLNAQLCGGYEIDKALLRIVVEKARKKGIVWKDDPIQRVEFSKSHVLLYIEDAKLKLSREIGENARIGDDLSKIAAPVFLEMGTLHPEQDIQVDVTGEDLKSVIRKMWRKYYGKIITDTVTQAEKQLGKAKIRLDKIDKVLVAGGSSRLPFMKEEILAALQTRVQRESIFIGKDIGAAVAFGIAVECRERVRRVPELSVNRIVSCLLSELFLGFRRTRRDPFVATGVHFDGSVNKEGKLISKPCEIDELSMEFELELPFELKERAFYGFFNRPIQGNEEIMPMNIVNDVFSIKCSGRVARKCLLTLEVKPNGFVKPKFRFREEGVGAKREPVVVECPEFYYEDLRIEEGHSFVGVDFGTSNSYVTRFLSIPREVKGADYPEFDVSEPVKEKLRELEIKIGKYRGERVLSRGNIFAHAKDQKLLMVFHSNKIEGNPLTIGETSAVFTAEDHSRLSKKEREAYNLEKAYAWMLDNAEFCRKDPEAYIRQINEIILEGVEKGAGEYRKQPVKISGMEFTPPPSGSVSPFMERLGQELRNGPKDRSVVEFAAAMHTKLVYIHPFVDANGRTARLLMNAILLSENLPIIVVNYDDKQRYLDALSKSNQGDISALVMLFMEYFTANIEEIVGQGTVGEVLREQAGSFPTQGEDVKQRALERDLVRAALQEVGGKALEGPLLEVMRLKVEEQKRLQEINYDAWKQCFTSLSVELKSIIAAFNAIEDIRDVGYEIYLNEYDMLSFDKYKDLTQHKKTSRTWVLEIGLTGPNSRVRFIFFFEHASPNILSLKNSRKVSLTLAKFDGTSYQRLMSEPINLREVGYADGQMVFICADGKKAEGTVGYTLNALLADAIRAYL